MRPPPLPWDVPSDPEVEVVPAPPPPPPKRFMPFTDVWRQIKIFVLALLLSALSYYWMSRFVITAVVVQGNSMTPTLCDGDRYLLNRWASRFRRPKRGELVVLKDKGHNDYAVKRVVGMPLDAVMLKNGSVFINGRLLIEPYLKAETRTYTTNQKESLILLGRDRYFVMGDNRSNSEDSRFYGPIRRLQIIGFLKPSGENPEAEMARLGFQHLPESRQAHSR
jgi:signal peptidase I